MVCSLAGLVALCGVQAASSGVPRDAQAVAHGRHDAVVCEKAGAFADVACGGVAPSLGVSIRSLRGHVTPKST